jgi:hypothetical protein
MMKSIRTSLVFASILVASAASPVAAQITMKLGDADPTTVLTKAQREFGESYLAAVTGSEIDHYKWLLHPATRACMNAENADYFDMIFQRRVKKDSANPHLRVEKLSEKVDMIDMMAARGWNYPVRPTHAFHIDLVSTGPKQSMIVVFSAANNGAWYEVLPCPTGKALVEMRQAKARDEAQWAKARRLAAAMRDPLRAEVLAFIKQDRRVSAAKRYAEATHSDLTLASRVVDVLEGRKR